MWKWQLAFQFLLYYWLNSTSINAQICFGGHAEKILLLPIYLGIFTIFCHLIRTLWIELWCDEPVHSNQPDWWEKADMQTSFSPRPIFNSFFCCGAGLESLTLLPCLPIACCSMWYFSVLSTKAQTSHFSKVYKVLLNCCQYFITTFFNPTVCFKKRKSPYGSPYELSGIFWAQYQ